MGLFARLKERFRTRRTLIVPPAEQPSLSEAVEDATEALVSFGQAVEEAYTSAPEDSGSDDSPSDSSSD